MPFETIYSDGHGQRYAAVTLPWPQVRAILGRDHDGSGEDDQALIQWLCNHGAPAWVADADEGWIDEHGWGLIGPRLVGWAAIEWAKAHGGRLAKYADPVDDARSVTLEEAVVIAREDPSLIYLEPTP
ncbi:MAG: hypothetical protein K6V97_04040 [Actinomycetia bacterium]|nr:hypothetical protein [Actinomycetes bacterium]